MDSPWRAELYSPSSACEVSTYQILEPAQLEVEIKDLSDFTKSITVLPYDPETWLNRARCLRVLGFPELGLGDAYKSRLLVEAALETIPTSLGTHALQTFAKKIYNLHMTDPAWSQWKSRVSTAELLKARTLDMLKRLEVHIWTELMEGLISCNCCSDYMALSKEAVQKFPDDEVFPSDVANAESWFQQRVDILQAQVNAGEITEEQMQTTLVNGGVYPTPYPWMTDELLVRDDALFDVIREEFKLSSTNSTVARSTIRNTQDGEESTIEVFGVTATIAIPSGETVLLDRTTAAVVSDPSRCPTCCGLMVDSETHNNTCCSVPYCSTTCSETALETFHTPLCTKDLTFLFDAAKSATSTTDFSLDSLLLLRIVALSLSTVASHPLKTSIMSRLTPAYGFTDPQLIIFNLHSHIITPILTLQALGLDPFTTPNYDNWVLHTIRCRLQNNKHGQTLQDSPGTAVNGLYSMFNHSCAANVDWRHDSGDSTVTMFVTRDVSVGEELCISYIKAEGRTRSERQTMLRSWLGMDCKCSRCEDEKDK